MATEHDKAATDARQHFDDAFDELQQQSHDAALTRSTADFADLSARAAELDEARGRAWRAKKQIVSRRDIATPDYVASPTGVVDTSRRGRVFAIIGGLLVAMVVPLIWFGWTSGTPDIALSVTDQRVVTTRLDDGASRCSLEITAEVTNNADAPWQFENARAIVNRRAKQLTVLQADEAAPGETVTWLFEGTITRDELPCPVIDDVQRGSFTLDLRRVTGERGSTSLKVQL